MSDEVKEYVITATDSYDAYILHEELVLPTENLEKIPDRAVEVADSMYGNYLSASYFLTDQEAKSLSSDSRVCEVVDPLEISIRKFPSQEGTFDKTTNNSGDVQNWGLLRHTDTSNVFGTSLLDPGGVYDYVLDGTGVDVVVVDSGIQADHPEFNDANGVSRVKQIDWYVAAGIAGTMPSGFYADYDGHGTHVAATMAGRTFGWAKNADIYSMKIGGLEGAPDPNPGISASTALQLILEWHKNKTNDRPTVINNSWGAVWYWDTASNQISFNATTYFNITSLTYRGSEITSGFTKDTAKGLIGSQISPTVYVFGRRLSFIDSWISSMATEGIVVCNAAGNNGMKIDVLGGNDYDNTIVSSGGTVQYNRGSSPNADGVNGFEVGSIGLNFISGTEAKSSYSDTGPGVEIYAAGDRIISAMSEINDDNSNVPYYLNSSFKQQRLSGTSMASPQIAGMCALLLQAHPDWTTSQVRRWMNNNAQNILYSTGLDNDYTVASSLVGGAGRVAYMPMNGQLVFTLSEV